MKGNKLPPVLSNIVIGGVVTYLVLLAILYVAQRHLMYHPTDERPRPAAYGLHRASVAEVPSHDDLSLYSWWQEPAREGRHVVLYFHGNAGSIAGRADRAQYFARQGMGYLLPSYRYNAGAGGQPSEEALIADAEAAYDWLLSRGVAPDRIILYGESLGSGVAVAMAKRRDVAAVILEAPYSSIAEVAQSVYWYMPARWLVHDKFDSVDLIGALDIPILVVHGARDRTIPLHFARSLHRAAPEDAEMVILPDAGHADLYDHGMEAHVLDFIDRRVTEPDFARQQRLTGD